MVDQILNVITLEREGEPTLHGMTAGQGSSLALHIHGSWGNFYENPFVVELAGSYISTGYQYASINTPGHDYGTINEKFDDSFLAIQSWCEQLTGSDTKILLQGHSLGALKILRMKQLEEFKEFFESVIAIVLLSPFDLVGFYGGRNPERRRAHAKEFRDQFGERAILPNTIFNQWPISAGTFLELSEPGSEYDLFPSRLGQVDTLSKIEVPTLVVLGSQDFASDPTATDVSSAVEITSATCKLIEGAPHNFAGFESSLSKHVLDFIENL